MSIGTISGPFVGSARRQSTAVRVARWLFQFHQSSKLESVLAGAADGRHSNPVTVVCISDTHNTTPASIPAGDILLHAGDLSQYGTFAEVQAQLAWLNSQPHPHKVVIAGNHDLLLDAAFVAGHPDRELDRHPGQHKSDLNWGDVLYLEHGATCLEIQGKDRSVRIFGSPWTPKFGSWAFQYDAGEPIWKNAVPDDTNVLLTHGPPKGHLDDGGKGCANLLAELWRTRPEVVVCGHIHPGRGEEWLPFDQAQAYYENVILGRRPWMSVLGLAFCVFWRGVARVTPWTSAHTAAGQESGTRLVNAAVVGGPGNTERLEAIVLYL